MRKHPMSPFVEYIGYDIVKGKLITTIKCESVNLFESAIEICPVKRYRTEEEAFEGHKKLVIENQ